ncbi:hypothetical protein HHJ81_01695 [Mobiluncus mulieris]|uniref:hypothetical protein n=1 Tax=Mobiluncus mulieris TaxID=2052 RepID=UPI00146FEE5F|nr:hypothetical protein [Mobiluncus mulieris]NMW59824.1 hypothetical protein [Mobiluncus mulieris]NMW82263.1 hypothetical protein [Mobiluncus mulieris]
MSDVDVEKPGWLADREEQARTWRESMDAVVAGLVDTEKLRGFVEGAVGMPGRSVGNTALVLFQFAQLKESGLVSADRPTACLGFHEWKTRGRHVQTGQQGMKILRPVTGRLIPSGVVGAGGKPKMRVLRSGEQPPEGVVPKVKVFGFQASTVFDVSQTEGYPIVSRDKTAPAPDLVRAAVAAELRRLGYGVRLGAGQEMDDRMVSASLGALTLPGENLVLIRSEDTVTQVEALTHELGHITMGHAGQHSTRRGRKEVEADVVAGMLNMAYGLNTWPIQEGYDSAWAGAENVTQMVGKTLDSARRRAGEHSASIAASVGVADPLAPLEIPPVGAAAQALKETGIQSSAIEVAPHETANVPPPLVRIDQPGM